MPDLLQELKLALRSLRRRPGFAGTTLLTLALGIGANVAIFAVVYAVLIRPLPYPNPDRIVWVTHDMPALNMRNMRNSAITLELYQRLASSFEVQSALFVAEANLTGAGEPVRAQLLRVTPSFFDVIRVSPIMGRVPGESEAGSGAPRVAVLTHLGWRKYFGGAQDVVGRTVHLDNEPVRIIGVMPASFTHPYRSTELLVPHKVDYQRARGAFSIGALMRLRPGVTLEVARAEVTRLTARIPEIDAGMDAEFLKHSGFTARVITLRDYLVSDAETGLWIVLGTVAFLLLVACASVANLFLIRAEARQREVGVRFALGATRARLAVTFLSESLLIAVASGVMGVLIAWYGVRALVAAGPAQLPRLQEIALDAPTITFATLISLVAGVIFGLLPLPAWLRYPLQSIVRAGRGSADHVDQQRVRKTLIVAQIALALVMVIGSGLMLRSFQELRSVEPGVRPEGVLTVSIAATDQSASPTAAARYQRMIDEITRLPGTSSVGAVSALPLDPGSLNGGSFSVRGVERPESELAPMAFYAMASARYFEAMGTRLLRGRALERSDHEQRRNVVVISETFARAMGGDPIGREIMFGGDSTWLQVVGIVQDVRIFTLREETRPMGYVPLANTLEHADMATLNLIVRTNGDPLDLVEPVRAAIRRIDPVGPIISARTMQHVVAGSMAETSFTMTILLIAAVVALLLGAIGLYGVVSYVVSQRTAEIGLRIALGALPARVQTLVLRQAFMLAALGISAGLAGAFALSRFLQAILFQVNSRDPFTFTLVAVVMFVVSGVAAYLPARRAARVSPLEALRTE
jgi:putative ABC transport system permease protein